MDGIKKERTKVTAERDKFLMRVDLLLVLLLRFHLLLHKTEYVLRSECLPLLHTHSTLVCLSEIDFHSL